MIGIKVSKPGVDVQRASDSDYVLNSEFPMLKLYKEGTFDTDNYGSDFKGFTIAEHDLGYVPIFMVFMLTPDFGEAPVNATDTTLLPPGKVQFFAMNDKKLFVRDTVEGLWRGKYYIFANRLEDNFVTDTFSKSGETVNKKYKDKKTFGLKVSREGFDVLKTSINDESITSSAGVQSIHSVTSGVSEGGAKWAHHNLGYVPMFFCYSLIDSYGDNSYQLILNATDASVGANEKSVYVSHGYPGKYSIIIFKDAVI